MITLFVDTHFKNIAICLYKNNMFLDKLVMESVKNHSVYTMPMIRKILQKNELSVNDIKQIVVCNGPGSFTGVRIGVTISKVLAYSLKIPIKTITSIEMVAANCNNDFVCVPENNGFYYAPRINLDDIKYMKKSDFETFKLNNDCGVDIKINYENFLSIVENKSCCNVHDVNPLYVKKIEALNDSN